MNTFQKFGIFLVRLIGSAICVRGAVGPVTALINVLAGIQAPAIETRQWLGSAEWIVFGILLVLISKPAGTYLGEGLE
jgi:hypothetical protein